MSRSGAITLEFAGEERVFRIGIKQWEAIQEKCDAGPPELLARLGPPVIARQLGLTAQQIHMNGYLGRWRVNDVREPILQGLVGGGMALPDATRLVKAWVDEGSLADASTIAYQVVLAGYDGVEDEKPTGEPQAAEAGSPISPAASSGSEKTASTRSGRRRASPPSRSMT